MIKLSLNNMIPRGQYGPEGHALTVREAVEADPKYMEWANDNWKDVEFSKDVRLLIVREQNRKGL